MSDQSRQYGNTRIFLSGSNLLAAGHIRFDLFHASFNAYGLHFFHQALSRLLEAVENDIRISHEVAHLPRETRIQDFRYHARRRTLFIRTEESAWEFSLVEACQIEHELESAFLGRPEFCYTVTGPEPFPDSLGFAPVSCDFAARL